MTKTQSLYQRSVQARIVDQSTIDECFTKACAPARHLLDISKKVNIPQTALYIQIMTKLKTAAEQQLMAVTFYIGLAAALPEYLSGPFLKYLRDVDGFRVTSKDNTQTISWSEIDDTKPNLAHGLAMLAFSQFQSPHVDSKCNKIFEEIILAAEHGLTSVRIANDRFTQALIAYLRWKRFSITGFDDLTISW